MEVTSDVKLDDANLWIPGLDGQDYSHEQWITKLACALIESGLVKDEVLFVLSPICKTNVFKFSYGEIYNNSYNNNNNNNEWDMPIHTDRKITANRPDIVIKDRKTKTCKFIDMAVPPDRNTSVKVTEKLSKYKDLEIETSRMWGMRTETIPVIIGALRAIKKGRETYLGRIPGQLSISELQKITLLGAAHILRRVLSS